MNLELGREIETDIQLLEMKNNNNHIDKRAKQ